MNDYRNSRNGRAPRRYSVREREEARARAVSQHNSRRAEEERAERLVEEEHYRRVHQSPSQYVDPRGRYAARERRGNAGVYGSIRQSGGRADQEGTESGTRTRSEYFTEQMREHAPVAQNYHGRTARAIREKPVNPRSLKIRTIIVVALFAFFVLRFIVGAGAIADFSSVSSQVNDQQQQLDQLTSSNTDLQSKMDSMDDTIQTWNNYASKH